MTAPIFFKDNMDLWVSNGAKDWFCEIIVTGAKLKNIDISQVFAEEPAIAGCYGIGGLGIDMESFFKFFGGKEAFVEHLEFCKASYKELCIQGQSQESFHHLLSWAQHVLQGGRIRESVSIYEELPNKKHI